MTWRQLGVLFMLSALWGGSFFFIKISVADIAPMTLVAARLLLASAALLLVLKVQGLRMPMDQHSVIGFTVLGMFGVVIPFWLITWGEQYISSGLAAVTIATTPLLSVLITIFVVRSERLGLGRLLGLLVGFVGVMVAVGEGIAPGVSLWGRLAVLGAALCYAFTALYARAVFRGVAPLVLSAGQLLYGGMIAFPLALLIDPLPVRWPSAVALFSLLGLALLCTAFAYILFYWLLEHIGATRAGLVTYLVPGFALFYGTLMLQEPFTLRMAMGLALIVTGILIASDRGPSGIANVATRLLRGRKANA